MHGRVGVLVLSQLAEQIRPSTVFGAMLVSCNLYLVTQGCCSLAGLQPHDFAGYFFGRISWTQQHQTTFYEYMYYWSIAPSCYGREHGCVLFAVENTRD